MASGCKLKSAGDSLMLGQERETCPACSDRENSATLTPFGSLIRIQATRAGGAKSWSAKLRALLAFLFR
jgi:hypothetical protein